MLVVNLKLAYHNCWSNRVSNGVWLIFINHVRIGFVFTIVVMLIASLAYGETKKFDSTNLEKLKNTNSCNSCDLREADFRGVNLLVADLGGADVRGADFSLANLSGVNFKKANLRGANFTEANLLGANLRKADLRDATFYKADLGSADLRDANLQGVNFFKADLSDARLDGANINKARCRPTWCGPNR